MSFVLSCPLMFACLELDSVMSFLSNHALETEIPRAHPAISIMLSQTMAIDYPHLMTSNNLHRSARILATLPSISCVSSQAERLRQGLLVRRQVPRSAPERGLGQ